MSRRRVVTSEYSCDVCGQTLAGRAGVGQTVSWDGERYVVDLCEEHRAQLAGLAARLKHFVAVASSAGPTRGPEPAERAPWLPADARCRKAPPELFFPRPGEDPAPAKAICARCPALGQCRAHALQVAGLEGVWAAMTEQERAAARLQPDIDPAGLEQAMAPLPTGPIASRGTLTRTLEKLTASPQQWASVARWNSRGTAAATAAGLRNGNRAVPGGGVWLFEGWPTDDGGSELFAYFTPERENERRSA